MSWFVIVLPLVIQIFVAALMLVMPSISRQTLPLGVSIPQERVGDPAVAAALRRYRGGVIVATVLMLIATLLLATVAPVVAVIAPLFILLALSYASYWLARTRIRRAKQEGDWYQGVPVRLSATLTTTSTRPQVSTPIGWYIAGVLVLAAIAAVGVSVYDSLPTTLVIHWNAAGVADGFAPKSIWSAFGSVMLGIGLLVFLYVVARLTTRIAMRRVAEYTDEQQAGMQQLMQSLLGQIALVLSLIIGATSMQGWFGQDESGWTFALSVLSTVLIFGLLGVYLVRQRRLSRSIAANASGAYGAEHADTPDDDRYWKAGSFYVNRNDPALWVPKRFGIGWTVNLGHPAGIAILVIPVVIVVAVLVVAAQ